VQPLVKAITTARRSVQIVIFRFDQREVERALASAVSRGVSVTALIANTNRAGEENLRKLELRLLAAGVTVARTADDLIRYHGKWMIVDGRQLFVLGFNFTHPDIESSRSFGVITENRDALREAARLFECDATRQSYEAGSDALVVSPVNARRLLAKFIQEAKKEIIIYDPKVSDRSMLRLLIERGKAGVDIRVIGRVAGKHPEVPSRKLSNMRLHTRTIVRDRSWVFVGSQSLREAELESRREVGLIFRDRQAALKIWETFDADWAAAEKAPEAVEEHEVPTERIARRVAKAVTKDLPAVGPLVDGAVQELAGELKDMDLVPEQVQLMVKGAVKEAVREVVKDVLSEAVEKTRIGAPNGG
jgi:phosphatidylserine/phosphatidylglycerophosphate/cardiolipin synthase-like enzyme